MRLLKIIFIYSLLVIYSLEFLLFITLPEEQKTMVKIKEERVKRAKELNKEIDLRSPDQFYIEEKKNNKDIDPKFLYSKTFSSFKAFREAKENNKIIPFRGPINKKSISCAEDLKYRIYSNDKYGFKNSNKIYNKKINSFLLGDSYAEGLCVVGNEDIAGNLIKKEINTINFGVTDTGPLVSLGILKEFGEYFKPQNVIYLYFEGNDLDDLNFEKNEDYLLNYLENNFSINYLNRYEEIKDFLAKAKIESENRISKKNYSEDINTTKKNFFDNFKSHLIDIIELNSLKNIIRFSIIKRQIDTYDLNLFYSVIEKMNFETKKWNGNYYFVYVPSWSRYFTKFTNKDASLNLKKDILKELRSKDINIIDLTEFFDNSQNIKRFFPLGYIGHYNSNGYAKIAEIIEKHIK